MDTQKIVSQLVGKLTGNADLIKKFGTDPAVIIRELTGIEVSGEKLREIVAAVTKQLGINAGDAVKQGKSILEKVTGLFDR